MRFHRRPVFGLLTVVIALAALACSDDQQPAAPSATATGTGTAVREPWESLPVVSDAQSICEIALCDRRDPTDTLEELVDQSAFIVLVHVERELDPAWQLGGIRISRFELRVEQAFKGSISEDVLFVADVPGGSVAQTGNPWVADGFKPRPGEPTIDQGYAENPMFQVDKRELVFFRETEWPDRTLHLYPITEGRYRLERGKLHPLFSDQHRLFDRLAPSGIRDALTGKTLDEFRQLLNPLLSRPPTPTPALPQSSGGSLDNVRDRLARELPHIAAVVDAVERADVAAISGLTSYIDLPCAPEPGGSVPACTEVGVSPGTVLDVRLSGYELLRESGQGTYMARATWEQLLTDRLADRAPELVAAVAPPGGPDANRLYLFFRDNRGGEVSPTDACFALTVALIPAEPILYLNDLPACGGIVPELQGYQRRHGAAPDIWALAEPLRVP